VSSNHFELNQLKFTLSFFRNKRSLTFHDQREEMISLAVKMTLLHIIPILDIAHYMLFQTNGTLRGRLQY